MSIIYCLLVDDKGLPADAKYAASGLLKRHSYLGYRTKDIVRSITRPSSACQADIWAANLHLGPVLHLQEKLQELLSGLRNHCWVFFSDAHLARCNGDMLLVAMSGGNQFFEASPQGVEAYYYKDMADLDFDSQREDEDYEEQLRNIKDRLAEDEVSEDHEEWEHYGTSDDEWPGTDEPDQALAEMANDGRASDVDDAGEEWNTFLYEELDEVDLPRNQSPPSLVSGSV